MKKLKTLIDSSDTQLSSSWVLYLLILLSGAAGLIYEVVWARQLSLFIGNTAIANAAVLTAFMAGLAIGSVVIGRMTDSIAKPLRLYALLEIMIGLYGATTPWLFDILQLSYVDFAGVAGVTGTYSQLPRFAIAIVAMLIPTFLMGGTLPLLVKHFTQRLDQAQSVSSHIYGINTLGAMIGAFSAGFLLLPNLGVTDTLLFAAALNGIVGFGVYQWLGGAELQMPDRQEKPPSSKETKEFDKITQPYLLLVGFAFSGFAALLYQVVWIHSLILVIGVSVYGFSTILTVFLGGVGLGSLLAKRFISYVNAQRTLKLAYYLQLGIALSAIASFSLISQLPIMFVQGWHLFHENFILFQGYMFLLSAAVLFVPSLLLGALFPLITGLWSNNRAAVGQGVGDAYGANALGTIAGAAIGGLFILDWLGIENSLYLASFISTLVAILFWYLSCPNRPIFYRLGQAPLVMLLLVIFILIIPGWDRTMMQAEVFRRAPSFHAEDIRSEIELQMSTTEFLYYKEGVNGTVSVLSKINGKGQRYKSLLNNGKTDASNFADMDDQVLLAQLPLFLHEAPKEVMVIGLGSGITAGSVLLSDKVESMDVIEISQEIVEASAFFKDDNYDVLNNPRTNLIVADARNYLLASKKKYDIIISEPSHSWVTGVSNLFTRDFLQQANDRLNENGILLQWYHLYGVDPNSLKALLKAVSDVFPHYTLWNPGGDGSIMIISSNKPLELDYQKQLSSFEVSKIKKEFARIDINYVDELMDNLLMSSNEAKQLLAESAANTDDNPIVEFNAPKHLYNSTTKDNLSMLFKGLEEGKYTLPFINLVEEYKNWIVVPFMGIQLKSGNDPYSIPEWNVTRKSIYDKESESSSLMRGMTGEIILNKPWGDVHIRSTMAKHDSPEKMILDSLLNYEIPITKDILAGELKAPGETIYWRVSPSSKQGKLNVVLARKCEKMSKFDSFVSISSNYPGRVDNKVDVSTALREVNKLLQCLSI